MGVLGWWMLAGSTIWVFWGSGVDGKKPLPCGALATGDAKEMDRALSGEIRAGPRMEGEGLVGPALDDDVSVNVRFQGLTESKLWETVNENRDEAHEPILAVAGREDWPNRRDEARG